MSHHEHQQPHNETGQGQGAKFRDAGLEQSDDDAVGDESQGESREHGDGTQDSHHGEAKGDYKVDGGKDTDVNKVFRFHVFSIDLSVVSVVATRFARQRSCSARY